MALSEQELIRREKLKELYDLGINPYPAEAFPVTHLSKTLLKNFKEGEKVRMAGRLM